LSSKIEFDFSTMVFWIFSGEKRSKLRLKWSSRPKNAKIRKSAFALWSWLQTCAESHFPTYFSIEDNFFAIVSISTKKYFEKKKFEKIFIPWEKNRIFYFLKCKNWWTSKKDSCPRCHVQYGSDFFLNVPRSWIKNVRRTEYLFRPQFDLFLSSKIGFGLSSMVF